MYVVVDQRATVTDGYVSSFSREGFSSLGLGCNEFKEWLNTASDQDIGAVQGFLLGEFDNRPAFPEMIRTHSRAPIIALEDVRSLQQTLELFTAGIDDVVRKPVHVREIVARSDAVWRRVNSAAGPATNGRLRVFFDGRDPEVDGVPLPLPRRERHILEYLVKNSRRRVTKTQIFNTIYGIFNDDVDESVIEGHMSKLRKKLRMKLGEDVIDAKRYIGYQFIG
ncbi:MULTISPECIES: response regulator transcription factor [Azorhizobium]|uniref:Two-component response regulator n=1 Tax=Azorhizobium caulinodans (strain ATCC 43989 / DSM 5975 / JCM 20966 / LMG 6465 / NBRC 14845 / NCIMB 13405 / ORS 571) TaxID=438753 RepID=A8IPG5_AZOC5|nr:MULTISPECIES: response regulator transcription factor [Azorhizobium]TDT88909.1 transcriptional regulator [Azorhizobium sp. AG788]BAF86617.1 two-component response regulator [Azorhizobium caulinodans ORS 571]